MSYVKTTAIRQTELDLKEDVKLNITGNMPSDELMLSMKEFDAFVDDIIATCAEVSEECAAIAQEITEVGSQIGEFVANSRIFKNQGKAQIVGAGIELAAAGIGYAYSAWQQHKIDQKQQAALRELLARKQEIADAKIDFCITQLEKFQSGFPRYEKTFKMDFDRTVGLDDSQLNRMVVAFKKSLAFKLRWRYNIAITKYVIAEMSAWQDGEQHSAHPQVDWTNVVNDEIVSWPAMLTGNSNIHSWNNYITDYLTNEHSTYPVPIYIMLTEPFMLRNYIGVSFGKLDHCSLPAVELDRGDSQYISNSSKFLLSQNEYYTRMQALSCEEPEEPKGTSPSDYLAIIIPCVIFAVVFLLVDHNMSGFWFVVVESIVTALFGLIASFMASGVPCITEIEKYIEKMESLKRNEHKIANDTNKIDIKL